MLRCGAGVRWCCWKDGVAYCSSVSVWLYLCVCVYICLGGKEGGTESGCSHS